MVRRPRGAGFQRCTEAVQRDVVRGQEERCKAKQIQDRYARQNRFKTGRQGKAHRDVGRATDAAKHQLLIGKGVNGESTELE